jgi:hypothetical protein
MAPTSGMKSWASNKSVPSQLCPARRQNVRYRSCQLNAGVSDSRAELARPWFPGKCVLPDRAAPRTSGSVVSLPALPRRIVNRPRDSGPPPRYVLPFRQPAQDPIYPP